MKLAAMNLLLLGYLSDRPDRRRPSNIPSSRFHVLVSLSLPSTLTDDSTSVSFFHFPSLFPFYPLFLSSSLYSFFLINFFPFFISVLILSLHFFPFSTFPFLYLFLSSLSSFLVLCSFFPINSFSLSLFPHLFIHFTSLPFPAFSFSSPIPFFCLKCITPLVAYFLGDAYLVDVNPSSSYDGTIAGEVGAAFSATVAGRKNPVSPLALEGKVGEFHHQFSGSAQNDSHEFLMYLLAWLHENLRGGSLPTCLDGGLTSHHVAAAGSNSEPSIITILFPGMDKHVISYGNCQHESVSFEPFTVLSLTLPVSGNITLKRLLHNYYEDTVITYKCPQCSKEGESFRKTIIQKMPLILVLHLNRFEYAISARKKQNFVDFPVEGLSLRAHILSDKPSASYNSLCAVSNHFDRLLWVVDTIPATVGLPVGMSGTIAMIEALAG